MPITDPCEKIVAEGLFTAGIQFVHETLNPDQNLDFWLPDLGIYVEVKQFSTPRTAAQIAGRDDVILVQGRKACEVFAKLIQPAQPEAI